MECLSEAKLNFQFKYPVLWVGYMFGVYAAMYAPELYAATEVSGGPGTMEYLTFILTSVSSRYLCRGLDLAETGTASYPERKRNLS